MAVRDLPTKVSCQLTLFDIFMQFLYTITHNHLYKRLKYRTDHKLFSRHQVWLNTNQTSNSHTHNHTHIYSVTAKYNYGTEPAVSNSMTFINCIQATKAFEASTMLPTAYAPTTPSGLHGPAHAQVAIRVYHVFKTINNPMNRMSR